MANKTIAQPISTTSSEADKQFKNRRSLYLELEKRGSEFAESRGRRAFFVTIDYKLAEQIVNCCVDAEKQRRLRLRHMNMLAEQMKTGEFTFQGDTIRFDKDYKLCDGQHRLNAVVKSKTEQLFLVVSGVPEEATAYIDQNAFLRTLPDRMRIAAGHDMTKLEQGIFSMLAYGVRPDLNVKNSIQDNIEKWKQFEKCIRFAAQLKASSTQALKKANVRTVVARAYYCGEDVERLNQFLEIIDNQVTFNPEDSAALLLSIEFRKPLYRAARTDSAWGVQMYYDTEYMLRKFLDRQVVENYPRRRKKQVELWPIDGAVPIEPTSM